MDTYTFILKFAEEHWFITWSSLWLLWVAYFIVGGVINLTQLAWRRMWRAIMVLLRGWPPSHLDADGDMLPTPDIGQLVETRVEHVNGSTRTTRTYIKENAADEKPPKRRSFRDYIHSTTPQ